MNIIYNFKASVFVVLLCFFSSCSKEDDGFGIEPQSCDVEVSDFIFYQESDGAGLKVVDIKRKNAPDDIEGYEVWVNNTDFPGNTKYEKFRFGNGGKNKGRIKNITVGNNEFTAISYGGEEFAQNGWVTIDRINGGVDSERAKKYGVALKSKYPIYTKYKCVKTQYIYPKPNKNEVRFEMKPANGRLAIVVENNYEDDNFGRIEEFIDVSIDGEKLTEVEKGETICYILNNDLEENKPVEVVVECRYSIFPDFLRLVKYTAKTLTFSSDESTTDLTYQSGKNKTRLIIVE